VQKHLQQIIAEIDSGLTGDDTKDRQYLSECSDRYKAEPNQLEIQRHIGRQMAARLSEDQKQEFEAAFNADMAKNKQLLVDVLTLVKSKDIAGAEKLMAENDILDGYSPSMMRDDDVTTYLEFENPIEEGYYNVKFKPEKRVMDVGIPFKTSYQLAAFIAVEKKELDRALRILEIGIKRCPFAADLIFEQGEVFKMQDKLQELHKSMTANSEFFYRRGDVAHYFRNLGWYYSCKQDWDTAICCYATSAMWQDHPMVNNELTYIQQTSNRSMEEMTKMVQNPESWKEILEKQSLKIIPVDPLWIELFQYFGEKAEQDGQFAYAANCYHLHYDLTQSEEIKARLEACVAKLPK
jgi:hypothetical protein